MRKIYQKDWKERVEKMNWFPKQSPMKKFMESLEVFGIKTLKATAVILIILLILYLLTPDTPFIDYGYYEIDRWAN